MRSRPVTARRRKQQSGFILLAIFLMAGAVALMLYQQLPRVAFESERDKEQLLIERGEEYIRAIQLYMQDNGGRWPQSIEDLERTNNKRYLRKRYVDPYTGKNEWRLVHTNGQQLTDSLVQKPPAVAGQDSSSSSLFASNTSTSNTSTANQEAVQVNQAVLARPSDVTLPNAQSFSAPISVQPNPNQGPPNQPQPNMMPQPQTQNGQPQFLGQQVPGQVSGQQFPGQQVPGQVSGQQFPGQQVPGQVSGQQFPGQQVPGEQSAGQQAPGQQPAIGPPTLVSGQQFPGQQVPNQQFPGQQVPGQVPNSNVPNPGLPDQNTAGLPNQNTAGPQPQFPGQQFPGQQFPGQQFPGQQVPGQPTPNGPQSNPQANMNIPPGFQMGPNGQLVPAPVGASTPIPPGNGVGSPGLNTASVVGLPGQNPSGLTTVNRQLTNQAPLPVTGPTVLQNNAVGGGGIAGVASTYKGATIKVYKDRSKYQEWEFVFTPTAATGGGIGGAGGANGGRGGQNGPGGPGAPGGRGGQTGPGGGTSGFSPSGFSGSFGAGGVNSGAGGTGGNQPAPAGGGIGR